MCLPSKTFLMLAILLSGLLPLSLAAQQQNPNYDAALADSLGADDYGMKSYVFVMLTTGSNKSTDQTLRDSCFRGHMENIGRLVEAGELIVAGPMFQNEKGFRGIYIFNEPDTAAVRQMLDGDPAISNDFLGADLYQWYGSAALGTYLEVSDKIWRIDP